MSSSAYILVLFLCICLHACNGARRYPSLLDKKLEKKPHFSIKIDEKNRYDSSHMKFNEDDNKMRTEVIYDLEKPKHRRSTNQKVLKDVGKASFGLQTKSHVSISWRVPHKKHSEKHPGFNLDYSPPKTHPPSHN